MVHYAGFWKPNRTRLIPQLWDLIETSSFREDIKGIGLDDDYDNNNKDNEEDKDMDNNKDNNDDKGISALERDRDLGFLWGHQGHRLHDDDEEEDDEVGDNDTDNNNNHKDDNNNKDDIDDKDISALKLDRDLGFSRGHEGHQGH